MVNDNKYKECEVRICPRCSYPVRNNLMVVCPRCREPISGGCTGNCSSCGHGLKG